MFFLSINYTSTVGYALISFQHKYVGYYEPYDILLAIKEYKFNQ